MPPRQGSPDLPNVRTTAALPERPTTSTPDRKHRQELRAIFENASDASENPVAADTSQPIGFADSSPRHDLQQPNLIGKLKKRLSKIHTKSATSITAKTKTAGRMDEEQDNDKLKQDFPASLLNSGSRGGYDSDANSLQLRAFSLTPRNELRLSPLRSRKVRARPALKDTPWGFRKTSTSVSLNIVDDP